MIVCYGNKNQKNDGAPKWTVIANPVTLYKTNL